MVVLRQAVDFVREHLQQGEPPRAVCAALCDHCLAPNTEGCGKGCGECPDSLALLTYGLPLCRTLAGAKGFSGMRYRVYVSTAQTAA